MSERKELKALEAQLEAAYAAIFKPDYHPELINVAIPVPLHLALKLYAKHRKQTLQTVMVELLKDGLRARFYKGYVNYISGARDTVIPIQDTPGERTPPET